MNQTTVLEKLTNLSYLGFKEAYIRQVEDISYHSLSFEERVYQLLDAQDIYIKDKRIQINHKISKIKDKQACIEDIDYRVDRGATCRFNNPK